MKVNLKRINQAFHYQAENTEKLTVHIDGSPEIGGEGKGCRPMELMLMAVAGCVSIDLSLILKKQRQNLTDYQVEVSGIREKTDAKEFKSIHIKFKLTGDLGHKKVEKAIDLAINKYCSAIQSLKESISVTSEFMINSHL